MQYFQQVVRLGSGARAQVGVFRRPYPDDYRADEVYSLLSHAWEWAAQLVRAMSNPLAGVEPIDEAAKQRLYREHVLEAIVRSLMSAAGHEAAAESIVAGMARLAPVVD